jgi:hypothetical protein
LTAIREDRLAAGGAIRAVATVGCEVNKPDLAQPCPGDSRHDLGALSWREPCAAIKRFAV